MATKKSSGRRCLKRASGPGSRCLKWSKTRLDGKKKKGSSSSSKSRTGCKNVKIKGRMAKMCWRRVKVKKGSSKTRWGRVFVKAA